MKSFYDKGHVDHSFNVGDQVFISYTALPTTRRDSKLSPLYHPQPFKVTERIGDVSYRLSIPSTWRIHNAFHVSQLRPRSLKSRNVAREPSAILDMVRKYGQDLCLVHWVDSSSDEDSWVPASHICDDYPDLIAEFTGRQYTLNPSYSNQFLDALDTHTKANPTTTKRLKRSRKSKSIK